MIHFSNIPLKVTINECIDIAKNYSSRKRQVYKWSFRCNFIKFKKIKPLNLKSLIDNK